MTARSTIVGAALAVTALLGSSIAASAPAQAIAPSVHVVSVALPAAKAKKFKNCTALNKVYKHGVGKSGAKDKVRGKTKPVTNFKRSTALYNANRHLDRDKDGVACEKR